MFAILGIAALIAFIYARPQEFLEPLQSIPLLYVCFAVALFGLALDVRLRNTRLFATPQLPWVLLFSIWAMVTAVLRAPDTVHVLFIDLAISIVLYLLIAHGMQSFKALNVVGGVILTMVLLVSSVGVHQGFADYGCVQVDESKAGDQTTGTYDGRSCRVPADCYVGDSEPGAQYLCERIGLFGTTSIAGGRVRYRGVLQDPNELALASSIGLPLAFALGYRRRRWSRYALGGAALGLVILCTVLTRSRGGQLVFLAVLGAYFLKRFGWRGIAIGAAVALPVVAFGGRESLNATSSTMERYECWAEALSMWRAHPLLGVGLGQFGEYHYLTAHNAYLLALAELGIVGMFLFSMVLYVSAKVPFAALRRYRGSSAGQDPHALARTWSMALMSAFVGLAVGIFFLSFSYHYILWIYLGMSGALYAAIKLHDPGFDVRISWRDALGVGLANAGIIVGVYGLVRYHG